MAASTGTTRVFSIVKPVGVASFTSARAGAGAIDNAKLAASETMARRATSEWALS